MARCSRSSSFLSAFHAACVALPFSGRGKKLLPFRANDPRLLPSILRRTVYFQYAACSATSQMLWRPGPGRQAASTIDTRSEEHTSELQSHSDIVCRLLLEKKK